MAGRAAALCFRLPGSVAGAAVPTGEFDWSGQSVSAPCAIEGAEVAWALASAEQVWPDP